MRGARQTGTIRFSWRPAIAGAGAGSLLDLEDTRRTAVASRTPVLTVQRERVAAWISLYRAVGGGWLASEPLAETLP